MADYTTTVKYALQLGFLDDAEKDMSITYPNVKEDLSTTAMKELAEALIANKLAFERAPSTLQSVSYTESITKDYDIEEL